MVYIFNKLEEEIMDFLNRMIKYKIKSSLPDKNRISKKIIIIIHSNKKITIFIITISVYKKTKQKNKTPCLHFCLKRDFHLNLKSI